MPLSQALHVKGRLDSALPCKLAYPSEQPVLVASRLESWTFWFPLHCRSSPLLLSFRWWAAGAAILNLIAHIVHTVYGGGVTSFLFATNDVFLLRGRAAGEEVRDFLVSVVSDLSQDA